MTECKRIDVSDDIAAFKKKRLQTKTVDDVKQKVVKDILDIWEYVDINKGGKFISQFVAADINRLPTGNTDNFNAQFLTRSLIQLQDQLSEKKNSGFLANTVSGIYRRLEGFPNSETVTQAHSLTINTSLSSPFLQSPRRLFGTPQDRVEVTFGVRLRNNLNPASPSFFPLVPSVPVVTGCNTV